MSREAASAFLVKLQLDDELKIEMLALQKAQASGVRLSAQAVAERALRSGYSFSAQELFDACTERQAADASRELVDTDLDAVTGGSKNEVAIETLEIAHEGFLPSAGGAPAVQSVCLVPGARRPQKC